MIDWTIIVGMITGLVIFMYGIEHFSQEIINVSKDKFRQMLSKFTSNRFSATLLGTIVTAIIQSSTATTVITVSLVSSGLISFAQSLGIIFGANIGTTITTQLVALKVTKFAPYFLIGGFLISLNERYQYIGKGLFYFGLLFFGLNLISSSIAPIKTDPFFLDLFASLSNIYIAVIAGFLFTALVQSSSVTTGLVVILASNGLISLTQGIPILMGANIGTTVTTMFAASRLDLYAKRAAVAHTFFNVLGVVLMFLLINPFVELIVWIGGTIPLQIANAHTIFNIAVALIFLAILNPFKNLVDKIVKGTEEEILLKPKYLKDKLPRSNESAFNLIEKEIKYSLEITLKMFDKAVGYVKKPNHSDWNKIIKLESLNDLLDEKIEDALLEFSKRKLKDKEAKRVIYLVRLSNALEQMGDTAKDIAELPEKVGKSVVGLSGDAYFGIDNVYIKFRDAYEVVMNGFPEKQKSLKSLKTANIQKLINENYQKHIENLKQSETVYSGSLFVEGLSLLENSLIRLRDILELSKAYIKLK